MKGEKQRADNAPCFRDGPGPAEPLASPAEPERLSVHAADGEMRKKPSRSEGGVSHKVRVRRFHLC